MAEIKVSRPGCVSSVVCPIEMPGSLAAGTVSTALRDRITRLLQVFSDRVRSVDGARGPLASSVRRPHSLSSDPLKRDLRQFCCYISL